MVPTTAKDKAMAQDEERRIPGWDGDAAKFDDYVEDAKWYRAGLKKDERTLCVARLRQRLSGPAKTVVKKMQDAEDYEKVDGLEKFLALLAGSPLGRQPLPDAFQRIDKYDLLMRRKGESMPDFIVREDEYFNELSRSMNRVRAERRKREVQQLVVDPEASSDKFDIDPDASEAGDKQHGFFDNEMRGYKLLKNAVLDHGERQAILAMTRNSTEYLEVRNALRGSWEEDELKRRDE